MIFDMSLHSFVQIYSMAPSNHLENQVKFAINQIIYNKLLDKIKVNHTPCVHGKPIDLLLTYYLLMYYQTDRKRHTDHKIFVSVRIEQYQIQIKRKVLNI